MEIIGRPLIGSIIHCVRSLDPLAGSSGLLNFRQIAGGRQNFVNPKRLIRAAACRPAGARLATYWLYRAGGAREINGHLLAFGVGRCVLYRLQVTVASGKLPACRAAICSSAVVVRVWPGGGVKVNKCQRQLSDTGAHSSGRISALGGYLAVEYDVNDEFICTQQFLCALPVH